MNRTLGLLVTLALFVTLLTAAASPPVVRIGRLSAGSPPSIAAFQQT